MKTLTLLATTIFVTIAAVAQNYQLPADLLCGNVVNSVCFTGPDNGHAVGGGIEPGGSSRGIILRTNDGGASWVKLGTNFYLHTVFFLDAIRGYAIGEYILRTTNAGLDWQIVGHLDREYIVDVISFPEDKRGYIIGENDRVLKYPEDQGPYGVEEARDHGNPRVYPNPAVSSLVVEVSGDFSGVVVSILTISGQVLSSYPVSTPATVIDVSSLAPGTYLLRFSGRGTDLYRKFIRQ